MIDLAMYEIQYNKEDGGSYLLVDNLTGKEHTFDSIQQMLTYIENDLWQGQDIIDGDNTQ